MVLYFSGTGNSKYIAKKIAAALEDEIVDLNDRIKRADFSRITAKDRLVFVTPTYAWRVPTVVSDYLEKVKFDGEKKAWFVMNCGGEIGNASKYIEKLCDKLALEYMGVVGIVMPENYIALFNAPDTNKAQEIIAKAEPKIQAAIDDIRNGVKFAKPRNNLYDRFMSACVNPIFFKFIVKADDFYATDKCVGCGLCAKLCPLNNIEIVDGKPEWERNCTHCMACINHCPAQAIEYGEKSKGKPRYHLD